MPFSIQRIFILKENLVQMSKERENNPMWGKRHTQTTKIKMSQTALERWCRIREAISGMDKRIIDILRTELKPDCFANRKNNQYERKKLQKPKVQ